MSKTIYCAQAFWRRGGELRPGQVHQFLNAERARLGAEILSRSADGAAAFSLTGETDVNYWEAPVILAQWGQCPTTEPELQVA